MKVTLTIVLDVQMEGFNISGFEEISLDQVDFLSAKITDEDGVQLDVLHLFND